jgi:hypothetical protein
MVPHKIAQGLQEYGMVSDQQGTGMFDRIVDCQDRRVETEGYGADQAVRIADLDPAIVPWFGKVEWK